MPTQTPNKCCRNNPLYNIRRYDPIGRTIWIRDYFAGHTGQKTEQGGNYPCRCFVDTENERIFVSGPLIWERESDHRTWWNCVCYSLSGQLLWKRRFGRDDTSGGATDVITVNGRNFIQVQETHYAGPIPDEFGLTLVEFDVDGNQIDKGTTVNFFTIGPRFLAANPDKVYRLPPMDSGHQPAGIMTLGTAAPGIGQCGAYLPEDDSFVVGVKEPTPSGAVFDIIWRTRAGDTTYTGGDGMINYTWLEGAQWTIQDNPHDLFGTPVRVWIIPREMARAPESNVICATDFATYYLFDGTGVTNGVSLGSGTLVRLDDDGNPVWFRGHGAYLCVASDDDERLYAGALLPSELHPSIQRWTMDGEFIWGHKHNSINQVAIVGDAGTVTVGNRARYAVNELNWIRELDE